MNARDSETQRTPLHHAAERGAKSMIQLLLDYKADVRARTLDGSTPIEFVPLDRVEVAELLIANGAPREPWENRKRDAQKPADSPPPEKK